MVRHDLTKTKIYGINIRQSNTAVTWVLCKTVGGYNSHPRKGAPYGMLNYSQYKRIIAPVRSRAIISIRIV